MSFPPPIKAFGGKLQRESTFKIILEYDGSGFCGWQAQGQGERTVQSELEAALSRIFKAPIKVVASGRTDSGVHALGQVVSFKAHTRMKPLEIQKALNALLPPDMAVHEAAQVRADFHAQYSVKEKTYRYTILNRRHRSAFLHERVYFYPYPLNLTAMRKGAKHLLGRHDFKSFQAHDPLRAERQTVRTIKKITIRRCLSPASHGDWPLHFQDCIFIDITADGFLYKMVRNIAGTLIGIGSGQLSPQDIPKILKAKDRNKAWDTAPAEGLCLMKVRY